MATHVLASVNIDGNDPEEIPIFINELTTAGWSQNSNVPSAFVKQFDGEVGHALLAAEKELEAAAVSGDVKVPYVLVGSHSKEVVGVASST